MHKPVLYAVAANSLKDTFVSQWFADIADAQALKAKLGADTHYIMDTESLEESRATSQRARDLLAIAYASPAALTVDVQPVKDECKPCTWNELTEYEKSEANFRGWPRGANIRYVAKRRYDQRANEISLVRFLRV